MCHPVAKVLDYIETFSRKLENNFSQTNNFIITKLPGDHKLTSMFKSFYSEGCGLHLIALIAGNMAPLHQLNQFISTICTRTGNILLFTQL